MLRLEDMPGRTLGLVVVALVALAGCGPGEGGEGDDGGGMRLRTRSPGATEADCPDGSTLTYDTFGREFFEAYCVRCHDSQLATIAERNGAPLGTDLETLADVRMHLEAIDEAAAAGPTRVNLYMPPSTSTAIPSDAERDQLGEWIACGAP